MSRRVIKADTPFPVSMQTTATAYDKLMRLDQELVGTPDYIGVAWFWHHEYRHWMRSATYSQRRRIHGKLLKAGLPVAGESQGHLAIVLSVVSPLVAR